jgi:Zn-dependent peptidase ImmA (M78 family)
LPDRPAAISIPTLPEQAAHHFGIVESRNFFAHTIREVSLAILNKHHRHYQILTIIRDRTKITQTIFHQSCCEIFVAPIPEDNDESRLRLALAHELGHLIYNMDRLDSVTDSDNAPIEEEAWAWKFAYALTMVKSHEHQTNKNIAKFVYQPKQLKAILLSHLKEMRPDVHEILKAYSFDFNSI